MSLPASHVLSASAFRHIGFMVFFMCFMAAFCALGFVSITSLTQGWISDIENTLNIEIPSYNENNNTILSEDAIRQNIKTINTSLNNDPIITSIDIDQPAPFVVSSKTNIQIPSPVFVTIGLLPNRAPQAEQRIINEIQNLIPTAIFKQSEEWEHDIEQTGHALKFIFGGLALSVFIVTSIILSAFIRAQIKANQKTIELTHLMGASRSVVATLFQRSILHPSLWGLGLSGLVAFFSLSPLISMLGLNDFITDFYLLLSGIILSFIAMIIVITRWTVVMTLRNLP